MNTYEKIMIAIMTLSLAFLCFGLLLSVLFIEMTTFLYFMSLLGLFGCCFILFIIIINIQK